MLQYTIVYYIMASKDNIPRCSGGSVVKKRSRNILSIARKVELLRKMEAGVPRKTIMEEYGVSSSTIYDLKKQKNELFSYLSKGLSSDTNRK